jgi:uncharacterized protein
MTTSLEAADQMVFDELEKVYPGLKLVKFYDSGSTARVYHVSMPIGPNVPHAVERVLKVFRHDGDVVEITGLDKVFDNEVRHLLATSHTNVIGLYLANYLIINGTRVPYFMIEYIPGAKDLDQWVHQHAASLTSDTIIDLLTQVALGLEALHAINVFHCDIKFGNLLVGDNGRVKIADFGFSKEVKGVDGTTGVLTTLAPFPKKYVSYIKELTDPRRMRVEMPRTELGAQFDLHYFGDVITKLLDIPEVSQSLDTLDRKSLQLMAERMNLDLERPRLPRYISAHEVIADLKKLQRLYLSRPGVPELSAYTGTETLRIPVTGSIAFTKRLKRIVSHPLFLRLHHAKQLGLTHYVFPGASHTRFEHSLGVFANVAKYINSLLSDDYEPYFRQVVDEQKVATTLVAGLLHDIGQSSFAHSLEDVSLLPRHEELADRFIFGKDVSDYVLQYMLDAGPLSEVLATQWPEVNLERLRWMIIGPSVNVEPDTGWDIMRAIVSGPLDADKTDYLLRDALHAGVEYPRSIDLPRFMNSLTAAIVHERLRTAGVLAITWKGAQAAEMITLARTQMFWVLYWHHTVRAAHAMVAHAAYHHRRECSPEDAIKLQRTMFCAPIGELLTLLAGSPSPRAAELASLLRIRQIYKRGLSLEFADSESIYYNLQELKVECEKNGDPLLIAVSKAVAESINQLFADTGRSTRVQADDLIVDVPRPGKDKLGTIYVVQADEAEAQRYVSRGIAGSNEDWQNRTRSVRVFVNPRISRKDRDLLRENTLKILQRI